MSRKNISLQEKKRIKEINVFLISVFQLLEIIQATQFRSSKPTLNDTYITKEHATIMEVERNKSDISFL